MNFLRKLQSFNISRKLPWMFCQSVVDSYFLHPGKLRGQQIQGGYIKAGQTDQVGAVSVVGLKLDSMVMVAEKRTLDKLGDIVDDDSHLLHTINQRSLFSDKLLFSKFRNIRLKIMSSD